MEAWTTSPYHRERLDGMIAGAMGGDAAVRGVMPALAPGLARTARRWAEAPDDPDVFRTGGSTVAARVLRAAFAGAATPGEPWLRYRMAAAAAPRTSGSAARIVEALDASFACQFAARLGALAASLQPGTRPTPETLAPMRAIAEAGGEAMDPRAGVPLLNHIPQYRGARDRWWSASMALQEAVSENLRPLHLRAMMEADFGIDGSVHGSIHVAACAWLRCGSDAATAAAEAAEACPAAAPLAAALSGASAASRRIRAWSDLRGDARRTSGGAFAKLAGLVRRAAGRRMPGD